MTTEQQKILARIKKLQAHAESARQLGSLNEYYAFAERITELLIKYNLRQHDLDREHPELEDELLSSYGFSEAVTYRGEAGSGWRRALLNVLCTNNFCRNVGDTRLKSVRVYGRGENVETTMWLYLFLHTHFLALARDRYQQYAIRSLGRLSRHKYLRTFLLGAVQGLEDYYLDKNWEGSSELMLFNEEALDTFVERSGLTIISRRPKRIPIDGRVYEAGRRVGRSAMELERKLKDTSSSQTHLN